jgi:hypothetical protein
MLYVKTEAGRAELQARLLALTPSQRQVLILCDGERHDADLQDLMPLATVGPVLTQLCTLGLLTPHDVPRPARPAEPPPLTEAERFRAMVELATSMAGDLGFASRVRAQLQIEKAQGPHDLRDVVQLLYKNLADHGKKTPLLALRLNKLRQLADHAPA